MTESEVWGVIRGLSAAAEVSGMLDPQHWAILAMRARASAWRWAMLGDGRDVRYALWAAEEAESAEVYDAHAAALATR